MTIVYKQPPLKEIIAGTGYECSGAKPTNIGLLELQLKTKQFAISLTEPKYTHPPTKTTLVGKHMIKSCVSTWSISLTKSTEDTRKIRRRNLSFVGETTVE